ncbi:MAG TPA: lipopolysaccharide assembly protein LapA domain-containing protein [Gaiellaceae bacterium]|nr:lipopolysaccharide assembly protein LapA domain-containing protein [Gaiellaceae bacterium]
MQGSQPTAKRDIPWSLVGLAAVALYALLLVFLNDEQVDVHFVFFTAEISKLVLILLCLGLGFAGGFFFDRWRHRRKRRETA